MTTRKVARSASSRDKRCAGDFANRQLHHAAGHDRQFKRECSAQAIYRAVETVDNDTVWAAYNARFPNRPKQLKSTTVLALLSDDSLVLER